MYAVAHLSVLAAFVFFVTCEDTCGPPHEVTRAKVSDSPDSDYVLGSSVTYKCDYGFITGGTGKISRCVKDSTTNELVWTKPEITCQPRSCGDPGSVANAHRSGSRFTFPNNVEYICNDGYKLSGPSRRYCEASGVWSGRLPSCNVISCERPEDLENGEMLYSSLEFDSELTYKCDKGLQLSSSQPRRCGPDGKWTGTKPFCKETECELPDKPAFGSMEVVGNKAKVGSIVIYKCDPGRKLVGSSSSKCFKTGEWTFPAPKCIEPCKIPTVPNGELGKYEEEYRRYRWRTVFKQVSQETTLDENEEVILKCDDGYVPSAQALREITITCQEGQLSPEPVCTTTSCNGDPPPVKNGQARISSRQHGHEIWYKCDPGFDKVMSGKVKCDYGTWTGNTPVCGDTRCDKESLNYAGLVRGEGYLFHGQSFEPVCQRGYEVAENSEKKIVCNNGDWTGNLPPCSLARCKTESLLGLNGLVLEGQRVVDEGDWLQPQCAEGFEFSNKNDPRIYCREGNWMGNLPPCSPAHCMNNPPVPENGRMKSIRAIGHGATVEYECLPLYEIEYKGDVICAYGKWTGASPTCKDSRCYIRNLPEKEGVDLADDRPVHSNQEAGIICKKGYTLAYPRVRCERGEWKTQNVLSPCQENDCQVKYIANGEMLKEITVPVTNFFGYQTGTKTVHEVADLNSLESSGAFLYVKCSGIYKFQGEENEEVVKVVCRRGEWTPFPVCAIPGMPLKTELSKGNRETATVSPTVDSGLQAFQLNNRTENNQEAKHDTRITGGKHGSSNISLEDNVNESSVLLGNNTAKIETDAEVIPACSCEYIVQDDDLVAYDGKTTLKFRDKIYSNSIVTFYCKNVGFHRLRGPLSLKCPSDCNWHSALFPTCVSPNNEDVIIRVFARPTENMNVGRGGSLIVIPGTRLELACGIKTGYRRNLDWTTPANDGTKQLVYNSNTGTYRMFYTLPAASRVDSGKYTCFRDDGKFHSVDIEVKGVQCPKIEETNDLVISYAENRTFSSRATFHCFSPYKRDGPSYVTCEASGQWSGPPASCHLSTCPVGSLYDVIPEGVVPLIDENMSETAPYGYVLNLGCDLEGLVLKGDDTATCSTDGKWNVGVNVHCAQGCAGLQKKNGSELIISPQKRFYDMGESITFLCPEGKELTEDVERILCFKSGWTPNTIPDCH